MTDVKKKRHSASAFVSGMSVCPSSFVTVTCVKCDQMNVEMIYVL
jgi:hypothetical protein